MWRLTFGPNEKVPLILSSGCGTVGAVVVSDNSCLLFDSRHLYLSASNFLYRLAKTNNIEKEVRNFIQQLIKEA